MFILGQHLEVALMGFVEFDGRGDVAQVTTWTFALEVLSFLGGLFLWLNNGRGYEPELEAK